VLQFDRVTRLKSRLVYIRWRYGGKHFVQAIYVALSNAAQLDADRMRRPTVVDVYENAVALKANQGRFPASN
jgi:hypothetical protein